RHRPGLAEVGRAVDKHGQYLVDHFEDELYGVRGLREHIAWYFKGYPVGGELRSRLARVSSLDELAGRLAQPGHDGPQPRAAADGSRGRTTRPKRPHLPEGWLDSRVFDPRGKSLLSEAELDISGG